MKSLLEMLSGETWEQKKVALTEEIIQREERQRQEATRKVEAQRREMTCQAPRIVRQIFATMAKGTLESIGEVQQLLGDRNSSEPRDQMYREVLGEVLVLQTEATKQPKKRRSGVEMYQKLHDFLFAASQGFSMSEELVVAFDRGDYQQMLEILSILNQRSQGSLAAAVAYTACEGKWVPATWSTHGFDKLKLLKARAEGMLRLRHEAGLNDAPSHPEEEPAVISMQKAS